MFGTLFVRLMIALISPAFAMGLAALIAFGLVVIPLGALLIAMLLTPSRK